MKSRAALAALFATALLLPACAAPSSSSYAGIGFAPGAADPLLQQLARRAAVGDKHAQLELGIRYEEGRGVAPDLKRAEKLYLRAATASGGTLMVYVPPVGKQSRGSVMPIDTGPRVRGLDEAKRRLKLLGRLRRDLEGKSPGG